MDGILYFPDDAVNNTVVCRDEPCSSTLRQEGHWYIGGWDRSHIGPWGTPDMTLLGPDAALSRTLYIAQRPSADALSILHLRTHAVMHGQ